jgi:capsular polysaccharide biosynthesis protein
METPNPQYQYPCNDDEIDLREIFKTISRWKYTIIGITIGCMLLAALISIFVIKPTYEARAVLSISSLNKSDNTILKEDNDLRKIRDNVDDVIQVSEMSIQGYQELITSNVVLERVQKKLKLNYKPNELRNKIKVEPTKEGNLLEIKVTTGNPELSAKIANTLTQEFTNYVSMTNVNKMERFTRMIEAQIATEETSLQKTANQLQLMPANLSSNSPEYIKSQTERKKLETEVTMRQNAIDLLSSKLVEIKILQSIYMAENTITPVSPATPPQAPARPNKQLNIAIAAVLGLMLSTMGVFMVEYMRKGAPSK